MAKGYDGKEVGGCTSILFVIFFIIFIGPFILPVIAILLKILGVW